MSIMIYNTFDNELDIINKIREYPDESEIELYNDDTDDLVPSIEKLDVCEFYYRLYIALSNDNQIEFQRLCQKTKSELFMCKIAHMIYSDIQIEPVILQWFMDIDYGETGRKTYDLIIDTKEFYELVDNQ